MDFRRKRLGSLIKSLITAGVVGSSVSANAAIIFGQNFNSLDASASFTSDEVSNGGQLTNAGSMHTGTGPTDLGFATYWLDTRGTTDGPRDGTEGGDFVGVNSFAGSNAPNTAADGATVSSGSEHNFQFNDGDGQLNLVFENVDMSGLSDRQVSFDYWVAPTGFEATDTFSATLSDDGANSVTFLSLVDTQLEDAPGNDVDGTVWGNAALDLESLSGFNMSALTLTISVDTNSGSENIFVDNILFQDDASSGGGGTTPTPPTPSGTLSIMEIQGSSHTSAHNGSNDVETAGIVTQVVSDGFFLQDPAGDGDDTTSDGIFVFTGSAPSVVVGDAITVIADVNEQFGVTRLQNVDSITVASSGNDVSALITTIGTNSSASHDRLIPTRIVDDNGSSSFDPSNEGRDFYESLEGMLIRVNNVLAVSNTRTYGSDPDGDGIGSSDREVYAVADGGVGASSMNSRGGITISADASADNPIAADLNPERLIINRSWSDDLDHEVMQGDSLSSEADGSIVGTMHYAFNDYLVNPSNSVTKDRSSSPLNQEVTEIAASEDRLTVASYNVLNLDINDADGDEDVALGRFAKLADHIVNHGGSPDVIGLQEVQDNDGSSNSGVTSAAATLQALIDAIAAAGGPTYAYLDNTFIGDDTNGGQPGGNIRNAFLYNPDRVDFVPGSLSSVTDASAQQTDAGNAFFDSRMPLAATFLFNGEEVTLINNHFASKGGSDPLFGDTQPPANGGVDQRNAQATEINAYVESLLALDPDANVIVLGDLNEFQFFSPLELLANGGDASTELTNLIELIADQTDAYSYVFEGNSQLLDHMLVSDALMDTNPLFDIVHLNTGYMYAGLNGSAIDLNLTATSDHDMLLASFDFSGNNSGSIPLLNPLWLMLIGLLALLVRRRNG